MKVKKIISWTLGIPAFMIAASDTDDLNLWWVQVLAVMVIVAILCWNGVFKESRYRYENRSN